ncbi:MAG: NADH-quinone oxidoreductase subunit M [Nitrososphaerota archaeon]|nr:NADH-quinone oxidoreductase subunit M [Nitrososphaerales archaeon]MDW8044362.1 NADH-quinone oxidoreductase subunit M [Nitrososphaerota archaeon]
MIVLDTPWLFSTVLVPFIFSLIMPFLEKRTNVKVVAAVSTLTLLYSLAVITLLMLRYGLSKGIIDPLHFRHDLIGSLTMLLDSVSGPIAFSIALVTSFVAIYSLPYMKHRFEEMEKEGIHPPSWGIYYMLYVMFSAAMLGTTLSTNLIQFYIFLELTLIPSFLLIAFYGYGDRVRIAIMYLIWTHVGALLFLLGVVAIGFTTKVFDILNVDALKFNVGIGERLKDLTVPVAIALMIGLFVKMAVFGVHIWLPYAHAEAPTPVSALLSPNLIGIGGYGLIRIVYILFPDTFNTASPYLIALALITIIYGGLMALAQDDFKRLLAYSSISQMGYILLGIASLTFFGITGAVIHYATHAVGKAVLFMVAGTIIVQAHGLRSISKMGGFATAMPITASLALIGFMHITGLPPTLGLWSEVLIVWGAIGKVLTTSLIILLVFVIGLTIGIGISAAYAFLTMKRIFFGHPHEHHVKVTEGKWDILIPIIIIGIAGLILFFYPALFIDPLRHFYDSLRV